jgi:hypothetical protein
MSTIWGKTGFRPTFYDSLVFGRSFPKDEIDQEMAEFRAGCSERLLLAKCHALKAYRTASSALSVELIRDADLSNQSRSYAEFFFAGTNTPKIPYPLPLDTCELRIAVAIDKFPEYFPIVQYGDIHNGTSLKCPCFISRETGHNWMTAHSSSTDAGLEQIFANDICSPCFNGGQLNEMMNHLHSHPTPVHSAAFAYLAFMSRDRLPDFGYHFDIQDAEGLPNNPYSNLASERLHMKEFYANRISAKPAVSSFPAPAACPVPAPATKRPRVSLCEEGPNKGYQIVELRGFYSGTLVRDTHECESPALGDLLLKKINCAPVDNAEDCGDDSVPLSSLPLKCLYEEFVSLPPLSHDDNYIYPIQE